MIAVTRLPAAATLRSSAGQLLPVLILLAALTVVASAWSPAWTNHGAYDAVMCETTPFWWPHDRKMYLLESICRGPANPGWKTKYGYYWGHEEQWNATYTNHSYFRIRDLASGDVVANISSSIGFGFGSAFVDYDSGTLHIFGTPKDRDTDTPRPYGPPPYSGCRSNDMYDPSRRCGGVWVFSTKDLSGWRRLQTDVQWSGANVGVGRVYADNNRHSPRPSNLPPHKYIMATESGSYWAVNNNADGSDLSTGWSTLEPARARGGSKACPSVRYLPSDDYYYTVSGGDTVDIMRSRDLLQWERSSGNMSPFIQASAGDVQTASGIMSSAATNLVNGHANLSFPFRAKW